MDNRKISRNPLKCPEKDKHGCAQLSHCLTHSLGEHQHGKNHQYTQTHSKPMSGLCQVSLHALFFAYFSARMGRWAGETRAGAPRRRGQPAPRHPAPSSGTARDGRAATQPGSGAGPSRGAVPCRAGTCHAVPGHVKICRTSACRAVPSLRCRAVAALTPCSRRCRNRAGWRPRSLGAAELKREEWRSLPCIRPFSPAGLHEHPR